MVSFYLVGHEYEFEIRNIFKIFDLNSEIKIYYDNNINFDCSNLIVLSEIIESLDSYSCKTTLYLNRKEINHIIVSSKDIELEKNDEKKLRKQLLRNHYIILFQYTSMRKLNMAF